jgi:hypothetical protein
LRPGRPAADFASLEFDGFDDRPASAMRGALLGLAGDDVGRGAALGRTDLAATGFGGAAFLAAARLAIFLGLGAGLARFVTAFALFLARVADGRTGRRPAAAFARRALADAARVRPDADRLREAGLAARTGFRLAIGGILRYSVDTLEPTRSR